MRKTTRTGFNEQQVPTRWAYSFARSEGQDDREAVSSAARGLPLHLVEKWTRDLCRAFDGDDQDAKDLAFVSTCLKVHGPIKRVTHV